MAQQDGCHSEMIMQLLRHVTSSPYDTDLYRDIFTRTIYPPSLVMIALIFSDLRKGGGRGGIRPPPVVEDQKKPGLNRVKT